jgi:hypothetical protein
MRCIFVETLDLVTVGASPVLTQTTLPHGTQEPSTLSKRARSDKTTLLILKLVSRKDPSQTILLPCDVFEIYTQGNAFFFNFTALFVVQSFRIESIFSFKCSLHNCN